MTRTSASFTPWATSCYNNPNASGENAGQSPGEAGRRVREMLTMLKPTVVTDSTLMEVRARRRARGADGKPAPNNLLGL